MGFLISGGLVYNGSGFSKSDILVEGGLISKIRPHGSVNNADTVFSFNNCFIFPGLIDVHVHLREPGYFYKETIKTGTRAAAHGGFTTVCTMPNLKPVPDSPENLMVQQRIIDTDACIRVRPLGSITVGQGQKSLSAMEELAPYVVGFSDDGVGVADEEMMAQAMLRAKALGKIIVAHCEDSSLVKGGCIHQGDYAKHMGLPGNPSESEWRQVERDLRLVEQTGCHYHVCHVSTKESVELIRKAKAKGLPVSCETAPHYLTLSDSDLQDDGRFRMNPPIRGQEDRAALIQGVVDGTIDMIATDHAPHSEDEKSGGLLHSLNGIVGLETAFPVVYTGLVKAGLISLQRLVELMHTAPRQRFGIGFPLEEGQPADLTVFDLNREYTVDSGDFLSMGKASPFLGQKVFGKCLLTVADGKIVWKDTEISNE